MPSAPALHAGIAINQPARHLSRYGWQPADPPGRPVLFINPRSGDGKAARTGLAERARDKGIEPVILAPGRAGPGRRPGTRAPSSAHRARVEQPLRAGPPEIVAAIPTVMAIAAGGNLPIDIDEVPLAQVEAAWQRGGGRRIVLRP